VHGANETSKEKRERKEREKERKKEKKVGKFCQTIIQWITRENRLPLLWKKALLVLEENVKEAKRNRFIMGKENMHCSRVS
jgi:hypothetical protein